MKKQKKLWCLLFAGLLFLAGTPKGFAQAPNLSLKDSIPIAEKALVDAKVIAGNYYIFSIVYSNSTKGSFWYYTYRPQTPSEFNQVYVKVYMDKTAEVQNGSKKTY